MVGNVYIYYFPAVEFVIPEEIRVPTLHFNIEYNGFKKQFQYQIVVLFLFCRPELHIEHDIRNLNNKFQFFILFLKCFKSQYI